MSGKAYLTKKKRDTQGLYQIPEHCRLIVPSLKTGDKDYKQSFTFNENAAAYLIPLTVPAADINTVYDDLNKLQRQKIGAEQISENGRPVKEYPDIMLLLALFSILQYNRAPEGTQDQTGKAVIDIRDLLVYIGNQRRDTAPSHYDNLKKKLDTLLYIGGIIGGDMYPVLSDYEINTEKRLLTFTSPYCTTLTDQITQEKKNTKKPAYCYDIQASICTARNKGAAAAVCYAVCLILQSGKTEDKDITVKERKDKNKTITYKSVLPGAEAHIKASTLISTQAAILERYEGTENYSDKNKYIQRVFTTCSEYFEKYADLDGYTFPELHITKKTINQNIKFTKSEQQKN